MNLRDRFVLAMSGVNLKTIPLRHEVLSAYALNFNGKPALLVRLPDDFDQDIDGTRGIEVHVDPPGSTERFIAFRSESTGLTPMFESVVGSLLETSHEGQSETDALEALLRSFDQLRSMFAARGGLLSGEAIRGLFAELLFILELRAAGFSAASAAEAWQGPYRQSKDFILADGRCVEVKSLRRLNHRVKISSIEQLDPRDEDLRLAVIRLERCAPGEGRALLDLVTDVYAWMDEDPYARIAFEQALTALGLDVNESHYQRWRFRGQDWKWFSVEPEFPRIHHESVPSAVFNVTYLLDIDHLEPFACGAFWEESEREDDQ